MVALGGAPAAAAALLDASTSDRPGPGAAIGGALSAGALHGFAPDKLQNVIHGLLSGDRQLQRRIVDEYTARDCTWVLAAAGVDAAGCARWRTCRLPRTITRT
jgi:hypothetical protein